ncbi:hypothetical protein QJS10_CPB12g00058 [Acorus calamus]|uniref:Uncharacterized protein n=1 Tax=Acorus calamus TaxID=4465 RepID=A0AAV9DPS2_ACOCL|nr:hypothetical protein QJS10_CPB12g00058 [Acorus calamus]
MDPYLKDKDDDDEEEEAEDMTIKPTDAVIACVCNEDDVNYLKAYFKPKTGDQGEIPQHESVNLGSWNLKWIVRNIEALITISSPPPPPPLQQASTITELTDTNTIKHKLLRFLIPKALTSTNI